MNFSLGEIDALSRKAARGAGYPWGLAEEAGRAVAWLCHKGLDGCGAFVRVLNRNLAEDLKTHQPKALGHHMEGVGILCPITAGSTLSDLSAELNVAPITFNHVAEPLLMLPFAWNVAKSQDSSIVLSMDGKDFLIAPNGSFDVSDIVAEASIVSVRLQDFVVSHATQKTRATPKASDLDRLNAFAAQTYAPATAASRRLGAGSDLSDND
ncbi:MAG: DUF3726 domain-containing protein [Pseudomonadota bacterium]